jgi:protein regulator of cytokinesis 1
LADSETDDDENKQLEAELRQFIPQWEAEHRRPFLVNGKRFLDDLDEKAEAEAMEKESKKVRSHFLASHASRD